MTDDIARLGYEIDSTQALGAARNLLEMERAAGKAANSAATLQTRFRNARGQFVSTATAVADNSREIEQLASKYNLAMSAELAFSRAQQEVARAVQLGVISADQQDAVLERLQTQYIATGAAAKVYGNSVRASTAHTTNLLFQFQDIGMMLAAGQNPLMLAAQQGTQVAGVFQQLKNAGQSIGPAIAGAFRAMISPMSLVTIGVIAAGAALVQWGMSAAGASDEARTLTEVTDDMIDAMDRYRTSLADSSQLTTQLLEQYGEQAQAVQTTLMLIARMERIRVSTQLEEGVARIRDELGELEQIANGIATAGPDTPQWLQNWIGDFGLGRDEAVALGAAISDLSTNQTPNALASTIERIADILLTAKENGGQVSDELIRVVADALRAAQASRELAGALAEARDNAAAIQIPLGMTMPEGWNFDPNTDLPPPSRRVPGGGQSEAEKLAEEMKARLEALREALNTEFETTVAHYNRDMEALRYHLNQGLMTREEYDSLERELQLASFGLEHEIAEANYASDLEALRLALENEYLTQEQHYMRLRELQWSYLQDIMQGNNNAWSVNLSGMADAFGSMNQLAGGGYDALLRAQRIFSAASALMSTYTGAAKALELPFPMNLVAMGQVLAAGFGLVNAIKGGSGGGGRGGGSSSAAMPDQQPQRTIRVAFNSPAWLQDMIGPIMEEIYKQTGDGTRVIFAR